MTESDLQLIEASARPVLFGDHAARIILELVSQIRELQAQNSRMREAALNLAFPDRDVRGIIQIIERLKGEGK